MDKKQIVLKHTILLFLSGGIIFLFNGYLQHANSPHQNSQRDYIVVKAFGAVNYHEPLIFQPGKAASEIISFFDLQREANLQAIFCKKLSSTSNDKNNKWQKIASHKKIYEDSNLKIIS